MKNYNKKPTSSNSTSSAPVSERIELLFTRFAVFYGRLWKDQFANDKFMKFAKKEWQAGLEVFSDDVLEKAIIECRDFSEWPPTLPKLIINCRQVRKRNDVFKKTESKPLENREYGACKSRALVASLKNK